MVKIYRFYDTDIYGNEEYDISENKYIDLLNCCIKYSSVFCFYRMNKNVFIPEWIDACRLKPTEVVRDLYYYHYGDNIEDAEENIYCLPINDKIVNWIFSVTDSIFKWYLSNEYSNPEDPAFLRTDGSVFFSSIIHDGHCTLYPMPGEDVSAIINNSLWVSPDQRKSHG